MTLPRKPLRLLAGGAALLGLAACAPGGGAGPAGAPTARPTATATASPAPAAPAKTAPPAPAADWAGETLAAMTLEQKAGQLVMAPLTAASDADGVRRAIAQRHVGAVLLLGGGWGSAAQVKQVVDSLSGPDGAAPGLWVAVDQEGGQVQRLDGAGFDAIPAALEQGRWDAAELERRARTWGEQLAAAGVNLDLAPVVDTVDPAHRAANAPIGALGRDYGLDAAGNAEHAQAFARGLAGAGVGAALKHFPGLGRVQGNTDFTAEGTTDQATGPDDPAVQAFAQAMAAEPAMVMVSLATYAKLDPASPAALSPAVVGGLLRGQLGWQGVVISDSMTAAALQQVPASQRAVRFVEAGGDIACFGDLADALAALDALVERAGSDEAFAALVEAAAGRVLAAKARQGLGR
ncbi:MAG: beta-glucosidase [Bifidobacteriaceae bacterium]|nr:beta-glucosidase [Bifidobacteriaceae bacterium]